MASVSWPGYTRLQANLARLGNPDPTPLLETWERVLVQDNREGILAGTDGWGRPMPPLAPSTLKKRRGTGPPLAPRGALSRVIANYRTGHGRDGRDWVVIGAWEDVLSNPGNVPFLPFHFRGEGRLPTRDLAHLRPAGLQHARQALRDWIADILAS